MRSTLNPGHSVVTVVFLIQRSNLFPNIYCLVSRNTYTSKQASANYKAVYIKLGLPFTFVNKVSWGHSHVCDAVWSVAGNCTLAVSQQGSVVVTETDAQDLKYL